MTTEQFTGNVYIFIPGAGPAAKGALNQGFAAEPYLSHATGYISCVQERFDYELIGSASKNIHRTCIGTFNLACFDVDETEYDEEGILPCNIIVSTHESTGLSVVTLCLHNVTYPVSQLLDRVSSEQLSIFTDGVEQDLERYLAEHIGFKKYGTSRVCLSTPTKPSESVIPYYFANETFMSKNMDAQVTSNIYKLQSSTNIAQYNSSDIYVGKNTVLRVEPKCAQSAPDTQSDAKCLFIVELIAFKDAAISRTNHRVLEDIKESSFIALEKIEDYNNEFGSTMQFWSLKVFRYVTAQNLAFAIDRRFGTFASLRDYQLNQNFLQQKVNIKYAAEAQKENQFLFLIAIFLFVFEVSPLLYRIIRSILINGLEITSADFVSGVSASSVTLLILIALKKVIFKKKTKL